MSDGIVSARLALAAVAPTPLYLAEASASLAGKPATPESFAQAGAMARAAARPISDKRGTTEYRQHLAGVLIERALTDAVERARGNSAKYVVRHDGSPSSH